MKVSTRNKKTSKKQRIYGRIKIIRTKFRKFGKI